MTSDEKMLYDVIILGGGLMGSAAAWHLSNLGKNVLLIEQQGQNYHKGSSKGMARITRSSNIEDNALWSILNDRSVREVQNMIRYLNRKGVKMTIEDIYTTTPISYIARQEELNRLVRNLERQDVHFEIATTPEEGKAKFGVKLKEGTFLQREYKTNSGTFSPQKLIQALHQAITLQGGKIMYQTEAIGIEREGDHYKVAARKTKQRPQALFARQLISAAGAYTGTLLRHRAPYFQSLIRPKRVFLAFFELRDGHWQHLNPEQKAQLKNGFPLIDRSPHDQAEEFFAMIENYDAKGNPTIKTGGHFQRSSVKDPDDIWGQKLSQEEIYWSKAKLVEYLKVLNLPIEAMLIKLVNQYSCIYSLTDNEVPYVTQIYDENLHKEKNFVVIAGLSGVGAKGAMAYGLIAANLLLGQRDADTLSQDVIAQLGYDRMLKERSKT